MYPNYMLKRLSEREASTVGEQLEVGGSLSSWSALSDVDGAYNTSNYVIAWVRVTQHFFMDILLLLHTHSVRVK